MQILITFGKPIIVAVKGEVLDFGVTQLPLYDIVVSSETATFQTTYTQRGQLPEAFFAWCNNPHVSNCVSIFPNLSYKLLALLLLEFFTRVLVYLLEN